MSSRKLTYQERRALAHLIIPYHGAFYKFWNMVTPSFENDSKKCPTAQVRFNQDSDCIDFQINETFFDSLSEEGKAFVICHECLHIMLKHGSRSKFKTAAMNPHIANMALDIPINHMLVDYFGFSRKNVDPESKLCWIDTVFKEEEAKTIEKNRNFEYYFNKIINSPNTNVINVPNHAGIGSLSGKAEESIEDAMSEISDEEKEALIDISNRGNLKDGKDRGSDDSGKEAGSEAGMFKKVIKTPEPKPKKKWETVIKKWAAGFVKQTRLKSHWISRPRRMAGFNHGNMFIPSSMEMPKRNIDDKKIEVWVFQDTSGSCVGYAERFFKAFESMPKDIFSVKMHCFDTKVFKLTDEDIKNKTLYGFGGTAFDIIERFIQSEIKKSGCEYPKAVWVLTDGYGNNVSPKKPTNWYWFLTEDYSYHIPKQSKKFNLENFE